jgi:hypothetical protein
LSRLSPLRLLNVSRTGASRRVSPSSVRSNLAHQTLMMCTRRCNRIPSIHLSSSATQCSRLAYPSQQPVSWQAVPRALTGIQTNRKIFDSTKYILIHVDHAVRLVL